MEEEKKETKLVKNKEEKKVTDSKVEKVEKTETKKEEVKKETKKQEASKASNKKVETTKEENKKTNNNGVIIGVSVAVIVLLAILVSVFCMKKSPKKVVENTLQDLKTGAYAQEMLSGLIQGEDSLNAEAQKLLFEKLEWKVLNEKEEGDKATVEVEITNKDFKTIMGNYMQKALKAAFSGQNVDEEQMTNYLMEELRNEEIQTVTSNQTITLEKQNGKWEIVEEDDFVNAVLPGLYEAISAFN